MKLVEQIRGAAKKQTQNATDRYYSLLRSGGNADQILAAAQAAGIGQDQIERDADMLEKASELAELAGKLPALAKRHAAAAVKLEAADAELSRVIKPLEEATRTAAFEAQELARQEQEARDAARSLAAICRDHPHLVPLEKAPAVARDLLDGDARQRERDALERQLCGHRIHGGIPVFGLNHRRALAAAALEDAKANVRPWPTADTKQFPIPADWQKAEKEAVADAEKVLAAVDAEVQAVEKKIAKLDKAE